jgi:hypothetical protein
MKSSWTRAPATVDPVHETMDPFHAFYNRKIFINPYNFLEPYIFTERTL